jgi:PAS domain S-box-containing protein
MTGEVTGGVLLVDDRPENLVALSATLEPLGQDLVHAHSGDEALKLLLKRRFAVILLDVQMPGLDGFETAALIKKRESTRQIPIIFVTAISKDTENVYRGYSEGAVDYVLKPYDPAVLRSKVATFIELHQKTLALEESERRFRTAFANAPIGMGLVAPDGRWAQVNRALARMLGRSQAELLGTRWEAIVHPDERSYEERAGRELLAGRRALHRAERRCVRPDGRPLVVSLNVSPARDRDSRPIQLIVQAEDVTERRHAEEERAARAEAEAVADMVRSLQLVSDTALRHLALDDLLPELLDRVLEILHADTASILVLDEAGASLTVRATRGLAESGIGQLVEGGTFAGRVAKLGEPIVVDDLEASELSAPGLRGTGVRSLVGVPLVSEGHVTGVMRAGSRTPGRFTDDDARLLSLVADRAAIAMANASLYEREHRIVETLQRSLLPARLPQIPGAAIAARYLPGGAGADVGGDWYDALMLRNGSMGLAMGDVVGHGLPAAALMGQLRNALRAYAMEGHAPAEVLARLDRLLQELEGERHMATLLYGVLDSSLGSIRLASAGHPPPLVLGADGGAEFVWGGRSSPIGVVDSDHYSELEIAVEDGSTVLMYTDGLVEVRGESLDDGLDRLREAAVAGPTGPDELCDHLTETMLGTQGPRDDVALLALRMLPIGDRLRLDLPADPKALASVRRTLSRWLDRAGATPDERQEIELACHEACANAIEHAYRFGDALFHVEASVEDDQVALVVRDTGGWREPGGTDRGRGIDLMRAMMDDVGVDGGRRGTEVELRRRLGGAREKARAKTAPAKR